MNSPTTDSVTTQPPQSERRGPIGWWHHTPLYVRIMFALVIGVCVGLQMGKDAESLKQISDLVLRLLRALVVPLIFAAVVHALVQAQAGGRMFKRMAFLLVTNTLAAIFIGLLVANTLQPGRWASLAPPASTAATASAEPESNFDAAVEQSIKRIEEKSKKRPFNPAAEFASKVPDSIVGAFTAGKDILSVILIAIAFGIALRIVRERQKAAGETGYQVVEKAVETLFQCLMVALHWIIDLVPFAVFAVVASVVGTKGFEPFKALGAMIVAVLTALLLQVCFYMIRLRISSWVRPGRFFRGGADAFSTAFATASSTATMPITFAGLRDKVGLREESASMGALMGSNFNNDGTALYEAMATMFIAQAIGQPIALVRQPLVAFMSVIASVGAPGIPEAGLVTMLLVFATVGLPLEYVPLLLTIDWFLDRCRTTVNVMGDMTVACILDGKSRDAQSAAILASEREPGS